MTANVWGMPVSKTVTGTVTVNFDGNDITYGSQAANINFDSNVSSDYYNNSSSDKTISYIKGSWTVDTVLSITWL